MATKTLVCLLGKPLDTRWYHVLADEISRSIAQSSYGSRIFGREIALPLLEAP